MRKKITHDLQYRQEGIDGKKEIEVDFVSNRIMKDYSNLVTMATEADQANDRMSDLNTLIASEKVNKKDGWKVRVEQHTIELKSCIDKIMAFNDNGYFEKRFDVLKRLLIDNGYKDDPLIMNMDFWEECVDPMDLITFLTVAIYKDIDSKKKVTRQ